MEWDQSVVAHYGTNVLLYGLIGHGKTTLLKRTLEVMRKIGKGKDNSFRKRYRCKTFFANPTDRFIEIKQNTNYIFPFNMVVHATTDVMKQWKNFPVHHQHVLIKGKRFPYTHSIYNDAVIVLEDLPTMFTKAEKPDLFPLNSFLSGIRHRGSVFFITAQSFQDFTRLVDDVILRKVTHICIFYNLESPFKLTKLLPRGVCNFVQQVHNKASLDEKFKYEGKPLFYFVIDMHRMLMTKPASTLNPYPFLRILANQERKKEVWSLESMWYIGNPVGRKKLPKDAPLFPKHQIIVDTLTENPHSNYKELADKLGIKLPSLYQTVKRLRKRGLLPKDRYGKKRGRM